jgi:hypothetical protein
MPSLWVFADFSMTQAQFDADQTLSQSSIINTIQCILRVPKHVILFNYRNSVSASNTRASVQILADTSNVVQDKRDQVAQALLTAYQVALNKANANGDFKPFDNYDTIGINTMAMTSWVSTRTITVVPDDTNDFSGCPSGLDYSNVAQATFVTTLNDTDFNYFTVSSSTSTSTSTTTTTTSSASEGKMVYSSVIGLIVCAMAYIFA